MLDDDPDLHFAGLEPNDFHRNFVCAVERDVCVKDVENCLEEDDSDPCYQVLSTEKLRNRFWLMTNQERIAAVTQRTRWW